MQNPLGHLPKMVAKEPILGVTNKIRNHRVWDTFETANHNSSKFLIQTWILPVFGGFRGVGSCRGLILVLMKLQSEELGNESKEQMQGFGLAKVC